jgi:hypothetical protein
VNRGDASSPSPWGCPGNKKGCRGRFGQTPFPVSDHKYLDYFFAAAATMILLIPS